MVRPISTVVGDLLEPAREQLGGAVRSTLGGGPPADFTAATDDDPGWFGPTSVAWRVHADRSMLVGGLRALFLQVLHPLAMAGVAQHSVYRTDPLGRLARTAHFIGATTYGTAAEAERAVAVVHAIHDRVVGTTRSGVPYAANDPALLSWVHNVEVDSFLTAYQRYGPGLTSTDADTYVSEMTTVARRLGADELPETAADLRAWIDGVPGLRMTREARDAIRFLVIPRLPAPMLAPYSLLAAAAADLLSLRRRLTLGLVPVPLADPVLVRPATTAMLGVLGWALGPPPWPETRTAA